MCPGLPWWMSSTYPKSTPLAISRKHMRQCVATDEPVTIAFRAAVARHVLLPWGMFQNRRLTIGKHVSYKGDKFPLTFQTNHNGKWVAPTAMNRHRNCCGRPLTGCRDVLQLLPAADRVLCTTENHWKDVSHPFFQITLLNSSFLTFKLLFCY